MMEVEKGNKTILLFLPQKRLPKAREHVGKCVWSCGGIWVNMGSCRDWKVGFNPCRMDGSRAMESTHCGTYSPLMGVSLAGQVLPACDIGQDFEHRINKSVLKCWTPTVNLSFLDQG